MTEKRKAVMPAWLVLVVIVVVAAGAVAFIAGKQHAEVSVSAEVAGETKTVRIPVQGMSCVVCAASVKKALQSIDGVQEAEISLERREARVRYYVEGKVSPEQLVAAVNQLGYKAGTPVPEAP
jgi:copper chaperone CopZ